MDPASNAPSAPLSGPAKLAEVTRLVDKLTSDLDKVCMLPHQRDSALEQLKVYGRDPRDAEPIFTRQGIETLTRHAFNSPSLTTSRHALRCLANAMLLRSATRQIFVDLHYEMKFCQRLKNDNREDEFLVSRIILLTTYGGNVDLVNLVDNHHLADTLNHNIARHAKKYDEAHKIEDKGSSRSSSSSIKEEKKRQEKEKKEAEKKEKDKKKGKAEQPPAPDPMEDMSLIESLKLPYNITHFCPQRSSAFEPAIPHILRLLLGREVLPDDPMKQPVSQLISSLINLNFEPSEAVLFPRSDPKVYAERMIQLLDLATVAYPERDLDQQVAPLLALLRKVHGAAPAPVKTHMRMLLLPTAEDRNQPLGKTDTRSSRILRLSVSPLAPSARQLLSNLLFEMSGRDATNFVQNVGYGFASGFLFQNNVPLPANALDAAQAGDAADKPASAEARSSSSSSRASGLLSEKAINPITGQRMEKETPADGPKMTMAEKEREAERLMVLFDRLQRNGVITAENPMRAMQQEGRFEELADDDDSE